jgi:hypothetical protein
VSTTDTPAWQLEPGDIIYPMDPQGRKVFVDQVCSGRSHKEVVVLGFEADANTDEPDYDKQAWSVLYSGFVQPVRRP